MKTTLVLVIICISAFFAVNMSIRFWKEFQTRKEPIWKKMGFTVLAFIIGTILWPTFPFIWIYVWLKEKKPLIKVKNLYQQWKKYRGNRYIILAHSIVNNRYYTYGYIMPWWFRERMQKTCNLFYFDELNKNKMSFRIITEKEYKATYYGKARNYTDLAELMAKDFVDYAWNSRSLGTL